MWAGGPHNSWTRPFPCVHFIGPRAFYRGAPARPLFGLCRCDNAGERRRENAGSRGRRSSPAGPPSSVLTQTTSNTAGLVDTTEHVVSHRPVVGLGTADLAVAVSVIQKPVVRPGVH